MQSVNEYSPVVVGWNMAGLRGELRRYGDFLVRGIAAALVVVVGIGGTVTYRQANALERLAAEVAVQRHEASVTASALDAVTQDRAELINATEHVPVMTDGAWSRRFVVTNYLARSPAYGATNDGLTSTMMKADPAARIVAVDPTLIPYGSSVWIEGLGWFNAQDCGGAIKGNRLDVLAASASEAFAFGRQERFVIVIPSKHRV